MKRAFWMGASVVVTFAVGCGSSGDDTSAGGAALSGGTGAPPAASAPARASAEPAPTAPPASASASASAAGLPQGILGLYVLETTHRNYAVKISALSNDTPDITFSFAANHLPDNPSSVVQRDLDATQTEVQAGKRTFVFSNESGDCVIRIHTDDSDPDSVDVEQDDLCADLGFPDLGDMALRGTFLRDTNVPDCFDVVDGSVEFTCKNPL